MKTLNEQFEDKCEEVFMKGIDDLHDYGNTLIEQGADEGKLARIQLKILQRLTLATKLAFADTWPELIASKPTIAPNKDNQND